MNWGPLRPKGREGYNAPMGKTMRSIIHLLQRMYDVTEGAILLDGTDIRNL